MGDFSGIGPWIVILVVGAQSIAVVDGCATQNEYKQRDCSKNGDYTMIRHHCHLVYYTRALSVDGISSSEHHTSIFNLNFGADKKMMFGWFRDVPWSVNQPRIQSREIQSRIPKKAPMKMIYGCLLLWRLWLRNIGFIFSQKLKRLPSIEFSARWDAMNKHFQIIKVDSLQYNSIIRSNPIESPCGVILSH